MYKVLITGTDVPFSLGVQAMTVSTMTLVSKYISPVEFILFSNSPDIEKRLYEKSGFNYRVVPISYGLRTLWRVIQSFTWRILHRILKVDIKSLHNNDVLRAIHEADIVVVMLGDAFGSDIGGWGGNKIPIGCSLNILPAAYLGKNIFLLPQSTGPLDNIITRFIVRYALNQTKVVVAREYYTYEYLKRIGVNKPDLYLSADTAYIFPPASPDKIKLICEQEGITRKKKPLIGINISQLINDKAMRITVNEKYNELMAKISDYCVDKFDATVLLIPHSIRKTVSNFGPEEDDIEAVKDVYNHVRNKDKIIKINNEYTGQEMKGIIGLCAIFIGSRMHSIVAALSLCIPTIAVAYSAKTPGIMKMAGLEKYVCNYKTMTFSELTSKIDDMWIKRGKIHKELVPKVDKLKETVWLNGELIKKLIEKRK